MNKEYIVYKMGMVRHALVKRTSNKAILSIVKILINYKNSDYINRVFSTGCDKNVLYIKKYGDVSFEKNLYHIFINNTSGMGAHLRSVFIALYEAEAMGCIPVIEFGNKCVYKDREITKTDNPYEYYFIQPNNFLLQDLYRASKVIEINPETIKRIEEEIFFKCNIHSKTDLKGGYYITDEYLKMLSDVMKKYIDLNKETEEYINDSIKNLLGGDISPSAVIACHIRGTDYKLNWNNHPKPILIDDYFKEIDCQMGKKPKFEYIFLATDDVDYLEKFKSRYKNKRRKGVEK